MNLKNTNMEYGYIYKIIKDGKVARLITDKEREHVIKNRRTINY